MLDSILNKICVLQVATEPPREGKGTQIQPVAPERVVEDSEAKAEELKAVLEAMGSGGHTLHGAPSGHTTDGGQLDTEGRARDCRKTGEGNVGSRGETRPKC